MPLSEDRVEAGIAYWHQMGWHADLHNAFYKDEATALVPPDGVFDRAWWDRIWPVLHAWSANRRGGTRAAMTARAEAQFGELTRCWKRDVAPRLDDDIAAVDWAAVSGFTSHVKSIKGVASPVFTSKLCHFLAPRIFPVVDNLAMGNPYGSYEGYYRAAQTMWTETEPSVQSALSDRLAVEIGSEMGATFPVKTKLIELHLIGTAHPG